MRTPRITGDNGFHRFETSLGTVGLAFTERGIDRLLLPDPDGTVSDSRLRGSLPGRERSGRAPTAIRSVARRLARHLNGRLDRFEDVSLDLSRVSPFNRKVYRTLRGIEPGRTLTYGELAGRVGRPGAARAVGRAMATNPVPLLVPCHRVVGADRRLGGFSAPGGVDTKLRLLFVEGVVLDPRHAAGIAHLEKVDPKLRPIIRRVGPYRPSYGEPGDAYGALVEAIIYQQLSMKAAGTIARRVRALSPGPRYPRPEEIQRLTDVALRQAGLSRQKIRYLRDLADRASDGALRVHRLRRLDDESIIEQITRVKGLGRWSAQMFLLFHLGRLDVLPVDDLGLRNGVQAIYGLEATPDRAAVEAIGERWRPYRSIGTWYVWQSQNAGGL
jgi:methylated-DNA-[protein]-cysteine S-methyltransferase